MNRPTRVPASTAVRIKTASNRIAKWYQNALAPAKNVEKFSATPPASVGAPPVRERIVFSPISLAVFVIWSAVTVKPQVEILAAAEAASAPIAAGEAFIAK